MNIQQITSNKRKRGWLHQPLSLLCPDLTAWFKIKIKEICQHAFPQLRRILNCCGFYSASIWECQTNHEWGGYWEVCGSAVWILWLYFTNSKSIKPVPSWQRLSPYQFYFMLGTGTDTCHHTLGQKGKQAVSSLPPAPRLSRLVQNTAEQGPANLSHSGPQEWNLECLPVAMESCSSAMGVTWRTKNRLDEYSLFKSRIKKKMMVWGCNLWDRMTQSHTI